MSNIIIFTDGSSRGNPGPGGWGAIVAFEENRVGMVRELGGAHKHTTNNRMEMTAVLEALEFVENKKLVESIILYTDSEYVKKGATEWMHGWYKNNWRTKTGGEVLNKDIWEKLMNVLAKLKVEIRVIKGHAGVPGNERCDVIATGFADNNPPRLYNDSFSDYKINLEVTRQIPTGGTTVKSASAASKGQKAYSYVSSIQGIVKIHRTWAECEERVRGQSNARYKKSFSKDDENGIVKSFTHR